jgi:hypothetical protein
MDLDNGTTATVLMLGSCSPSDTPQGLGRGYFFQGDCDFKSGAFSGDERVEVWLLGAL